MSIHEKYMKRCLELARMGKGQVAPNPMVGCVIVHNDQIIGEGFHRNFGGPHAEVHAVDSVKDKSLLTSSRMYINLEPCAHHGKTPPCSDLIIKHQIPEVIVGCVDPFHEVSGKGIRRLTENNIKVTSNILNQESIELNKRFFLFNTKKRPYVILKWAQTLDGYMDVNRSAKALRQPVWISNKLSRTLVHQWRSEEQAIMVGTQTVINDNPTLNVRHVKGNNPLRIITDRKSRIPADAKVFDGSQPTLVFTEKQQNDSDNLKFVSIDPKQDLIPQVFSDLYKRDIQSVLVEGGKQLLTLFIESGMWDEARVFIGNSQFGSGLNAPVINKHAEIIDHIGNDKLLIFRNRLT